jgi:hypothetical protein
MELSEQQEHYLTNNSQRFWWHICIFADTQSQTKNAKEPPANAPRQTK